MWMGSWVEQRAAASNIDILLGLFAMAFSGDDHCNHYVFSQNGLLALSRTRV
jgi:hypothetical protein